VKLNFCNGSLYFSALDVRQMSDIPMKNTNSCNHALKIGKTLHQSDFRIEVLALL
jgi:hypothetical protein